jgi:hypothetical protein
MRKTAPRLLESDEGVEMKAEKRKKLVSAGWKVSDAREFLGLTDGEAEFVEIKLARVVRLPKRRRS